MENTSQMKTDTLITAVFLLVISETAMDSRLTSDIDIFVYDQMVRGIDLLQASAERTTDGR